MLAAGIEAVGIAAALIVYFVKSSLYENLLTKTPGTACSCGCLYEYFVQQYCGCQRIASVCIDTDHICISDDTDNSEKALELGGARYAEN